MSQDLLAAICLVLVFEGMLPFIAPKAWKEAMQAAINMSDQSLRVVGLVSMLIGVGLLYWVRS